MIRVALFDMGETLIHAGQPLAGVVAALQTIAQLQTAAGEPLLLGVVSNYVMPTPPVTEAKILALEQQYRTTVLEPAGLTAVFLPFESKVTISSRAGVAKPAKAIFQAALTRLQTTATLAECLFVTEEESHLHKAQEFGLTPLGFGAAMTGIPTFTDWHDAPLLVAHLVLPGDAATLARAAGPALATQHGLAAFASTKLDGRVLHGSANQLLQLHDPRLGPLDGVYVDRPTEVQVELTADGGLSRVHADQPKPDEIADTVNFVQSLLKSGQVALQGESMGTTHAVEQDDQGRARLVRKRYSAR